MGCGCRGQALARQLRAAGHAVRGTTRDPARLEAIEGAGAEAVLADPDRLNTLTDHLEGVSVLLWLMGSAVGPPDQVAALHGSRLESMIHALVDTPVRGVVYEATRIVDERVLQHGAEVVTRTCATHRIPAEIVGPRPGDHRSWVAAVATAVDRILESPPTSAP